MRALIMLQTVRISCSLSPLVHIMSALAELGIDIPSILQKTKAILLHQMKSNCLDELDFGGALIFLLLLGGLHLLVSTAPAPGLHCNYLQLAGKGSAVLISLGACSLMPNGSSSRLLGSAGRITRLPPDSITRV